MNYRQPLFSCIIAFALVIACVIPLRAEVKLPAIFGDHMVLQQEMPLPVWGEAGAGEKVAVEFAGQLVSAEADASGKWSVKLAPLKGSSAAESSHGKRPLLRVI